MALQHLYSRVPAKVSMFNRADSFDTFACSEGLSRDFIEKNLNAVCENKPTPEEAAYLRTTLLLPCYAQFCTRSGELVQSCTSYIQSDYTGERSAYLVHSLIYDPEEKKQILANSDNDCVNPAMFVNDIAPFNITSPDAAPVRDYPTLAYAPVPKQDTQWLVETYDGDMLRRFIYAMLSTVCGKIKSVFFVLDEGDTSEKALTFLNTIMQIVPYHLRPELSFVTRVSDSTRFGNVRLKCVPFSLNNIPPTRGVTLNFKTKLVVGLRDEDINQPATLAVVEFFFGLLRNDAVRREFLLCCDRAVQNVSALGAFTFKALSDLVFVFRSTSGMFDEKAILPNDDKLLEFFTIYEKARGALSDEYRINAAKSLRRYPDNHQEIPKALFAKITKIYPGEIPATKHVIMSVVLDLIHTDIMREKLFTFIKNNYAAEDPETQATICQDLARVYYGGFLQPQILAFFGTVFESADEATRDFIVEKVLLSVRTKAISNAVMQFIGTQYTLFSAASRQAFYKMVRENLSDADALSGDLLQLASDVAEFDEEETRNEFVRAVLKSIENEQRRAEHPILGLVAARGGVVAEALEQLLVTEWYGRKIFAEYVGCRMAAMTQEKRVEWLVYLWQAHPDLSPDAARELTVAVVAAGQAHPMRGDVFALMDMEDSMGNAIAQLGSEAADAFASMYAKEVLQPMVADALYDVFRHTELDDAVSRAVAYIGDRPYLANQRFDVLVAYEDMKDALLNEQIVMAANLIATLPDDRRLRTAMGTMLDADLARASVTMTPMLALLVRYAKGGNWAWGEYFAAMQDEAASRVGPKLKEKKAAQFKQSYAMHSTLTTANELYAAVTQVVQAAIIADNAGLREVFASYLGGGDKKCAKELAGMLNALTPAGNAFAVYCKQLAASLMPPKKGGIFLK